MCTRYRVQILHPEMMLLFQSCAHAGNRTI